MTHHSPSDKPATKPFGNRRIDGTIKGRYRSLVMRDEQLTPAEKLVAIFLSDFCMRKSDNSYPGFSFIVERTGLGKSTVKGAVKVLRETGWLTRYKNASKYKTNVYVPAWERVDAHNLNLYDDVDDDEGLESGPQGSEIRTSVVRNLDPKGPKSGPKTVDSDRQSQTEERDRASAATASGFAGGLVRSGKGDQSPEPVNDNYPENAFIQFWTSYPSKIGKRDAESAFAEASQRVSFEVMMAGLRKYVNKADDRAWCNPSTWLCGDRWEDEPAQKPNAGMDNDSIDRRIRSQRRAAI